MATLRRENAADSVNPSHERTTMPDTIVILPYDDRWPEEFRRIGAALREALSDLAVRIDHIGSTAVPGLPAKDVIDVQVTVAALDAPPIAAALAPLGYSLWEGIGRDHVPPGREDDAPEEWEKLYFRAPAGQRRTHLHVRQTGRANQRYALLFRDYLRAAPTTTAAYARVKEALARLHPEDADAYYDVKDPVCDLIIDAAERWASQTGYVPGPSDL
jgi:GrpB-like predicted nucleotidyltransferase (UPF0157 family)